MGHKYREVKDLTKIVIRLRGDGKTYQFRVKPNRNTYFSYIYNFDTNNNWQDFYKIKELMVSPIIFDGRNQYSLETMRRLNFDYQQIGVKG